jgi:hypothetical protein
MGDGTCPILPNRDEDALPTISIPLRKQDKEVVLELQPLIEQVYRNGRYVSINYREDAEPPLIGEDAKWADELLRAAGKR